MRQQQKHGPRIYTRSEHCISRKQISENALKVLYRLRKSGFDAYLVGGCVRDLLLGREPKDFDVVTNAHPEEIRDTFRNCRLIGRRFRLAHIHFGREIIEVATFRSADTDGDRVVENGRILRDNIYGTIEDDVWRRDFTVNALYYNIEDFSVIDYVGGMEDHQNSALRLIGDPDKRYREDPVRMLRAVRFSTKLGFHLHASCENALRELSELLLEVPPARLYDEILKVFLSGYAIESFERLRAYDLFGVMFPQTESTLLEGDDLSPSRFVVRALENTDKRLAEDKPVTPYFLFAALLWQSVREKVELMVAEDVNESVAIQRAASETISQQIKHIAIPRRVTMPMREVWALQPRFLRHTGSRPQRLIEHPRFRAAYDFLLLRAEIGEVDSAVAEWWTQYSEGNDNQRRNMTQSSSGRRTRPRRVRRPRKESHSKEG